MSNLLIQIERRCEPSLMMRLSISAIFRYKAGVYKANIIILGEFGIN